MSETFNTLIRIRKEKRIKSTDVAKSIGVLQESYSRMEHSKTTSIDNIERIADAIGCSIVVVQKEQS